MFVTFKVGRDWSADVVELDCVHFSKKNFSKKFSQIFFSKHFSKNLLFLKKNREIQEKKFGVFWYFLYFDEWNDFKKAELGYFKTFFLTTKMYTKLASIVINDEILSKVVGIQKKL
jgi:hypothetical protein